jgi:hypothetical protein
MHLTLRAAPPSHRQAQLQRGPKPLRLSRHTYYLVIDIMQCLRFSRCLRCFLKR